MAIIKPNSMNQRMALPHHPIVEVVGLMKLFKLQKEITDVT